MSTQLYTLNGTGTWVAPGRTPVAEAWSDLNPPWQLGSGESVDDNVPAGVTIVNYDDYSAGNTRSFGATLVAARNAATGPYYVRLGPGTYHITDFSIAAGTGTGKGYQDANATKYWGGCIGAGADQTFVVLDASVMTSDQLSGVSTATNPVQMFGLYAGSPGLTIPTIFSGITFRGNFQQSIALNGLSGTAPAPYNGINLSSVKTGSRVQFCRFQGFGFTAKSSPPYELGAVNSGNSDWTLYRSEIDGRLAVEVDAGQPRASGGLMWNQEVAVRAVDSWLHHTRRSGFAMNEGESGNDNLTGTYYCENFQVENIADATDGYAGSALGFSPSNVEGLRNTFTYVAPRFTASAVKGPQHITIATPNGEHIANAITVSDPVIGNTDYNGCLVMRYIITPNSAGTSPYYTLYLSDGLSAMPTTVTAAGQTLTSVLSTDFNAANNNPSNSYVVIFS